MCTVMLNICFFNLLVLSELLGYYVAFRVHGRRLWPDNHCEWRHEAEAYLTQLLQTRHGLRAQSYSDRLFEQTDVLF